MYVAIKDLEGGPMFCTKCATIYFCRALYKTCMALSLCHNARKALLQDMSKQVSAHDGVPHTGVRLMDYSAHSYNTWSGQQLMK